MNPQRPDGRAAAATTDTACPTCGEDGVRACVDGEGRLVEDHAERPPFFRPDFVKMWPQ